MAGNKLTPIPYGEIASAALNSIDTLLSHWLPGGKVQSGEYKVTNPLRADNKVGSFGVNMRSGKWADFATTDGAGNDLIGLYAYLNSLEQPAAAIEVADQIGYRLPDGCRRDDHQTERKSPIVDHTKVKPKKEKPVKPMTLVIPAPSNAPEPMLAHPFRGLPALKWEYLDANGQLLGFVFRFNKSNGEKEHVPQTLWRHDETKKLSWEWKQWGDSNRPLYGLERLAANPNAWVALVEGEKCADAPVGLIQGVPVTWPGGSKAWHKVDWSPLAGKKIRAWADCDSKREDITKAEKEAGVDPFSKPLLEEHEQPGVKAMLGIRAILMELDPTTDFELIDIPKPLEKPDGWDCYDAIHVDGYSQQQFIDMFTHTREFSPAIADATDDSEPSNVIPFKGKKPPPPNKPAGAEGDAAPASWRDYMLIDKNHKLVPCISNVCDILDNDERWDGVLAYDEFAQRVVKLKPPPFWNGVGEKGEWTNQDDINTAIWITKIYRFNPSPILAQEAVEHSSRGNTINPPKEWMLSLEWDRTKRLTTWLHDILGVKQSPYIQRVGTWFFMGMVKRVFEPGCKFDNCLVLEGEQGLKKSTAFSIIGGEWFGDTDLDIHNKDSMSALRGKMLYEFPEMGAVVKAEATRQKSFLTRTVDEYRPVYGRREIRAPRQVVFGGTTNEDQWNKDVTGARRFWPVEVTKMTDADELAAIRDQLFAEAVARVNAGKRYWPTQEEQRDFFDPEQLKRTKHESYIDWLAPYVEGRSKLLEKPEFTLADAARDGLGMDAKAVSRDVETRIGNALNKLGCKRIEKRTNAIRFWYKPPERMQAESTDSNSNGQDLENDDVPF